jgi:hypothetical protein
VTTSRDRSVTSEESTSPRDAAEAPLASQDPRAQPVSTGCAPRARSPRRPRSFTGTEPNGNPSFVREAKSRARNSTRVLARTALTATLFANEELKIRQEFPPGARSISN